MAKVTDHENLERIGNELYDRHRDGTLDFATFQALFREAVAVCGPDADDMEMFCPYTKPVGWWDWMTQQLQKAPSRRVA